MPLSASAKPDHEKDRLLGMLVSAPWSEVTVPAAGPVRSGTDGTRGPEICSCSARKVTVGEASDAYTRLKSDSTDSIPGSYTDMSKGMGRPRLGSEVHPLPAMST